MQVRVRDGGRPLQALEFPQRSQVLRMPAPWSKPHRVMVGAGQLHPSQVRQSARKERRTGMARTVLVLRKRARQEGELLPQGSVQARAFGLLEVLSFRKKMTHWGWAPVSQARTVKWEEPCRPRQLMP
ncbi:MAG: hypothetical protein EBR30_27835 [Cytophagia bacterium]|nr:hypothetical protein [Cytophagia bacterium]